MPTHSSVDSMFEQCPTSVLDIFQSMPAELQKHCKDVAEIMLIISEISNENLTEREKMVIFSAGLMHDIGKLKIFYGIVSKPGKLTDEEFALMREHVVEGACLYDNLSNSGDFSPDEIRTIHDVILYHHERFDGNGYMNHLANTDIPRMARLCAIADSFDAMVSDRVYKKGMTAEKALSIIKSEMGEQFDPDIAKLFITKFSEVHNYVFC